MSLNRMGRQSKWPVRYKEVPCFMRNQECVVSRNWREKNVSRRRKWSLSPKLLYDQVRWQIKFTTGFNKMWRRHVIYYLDTSNFGGVVRKKPFRGGYKRKGEEVEIVNVNNSSYFAWKGRSEMTLNSWTEKRSGESSVLKQHVNRWQRGEDVSVVSPQQFHF